MSPAPKVASNMQVCPPLGEEAAEDLSEGRLAVRAAW